MPGQDDVASQWASFDGPRRERLLARMSPDQKKNLRTLLESAGHGIDAAPAAPAPDKPGLLKRAASAIGNAWDAVNTPIGSHFDAYNAESKKLDQVQDFAQTEAGRKAYEQHPVLTSIRSVAAGMERDVANLLTPAFAATSALPVAASATKAFAPGTTAAVNAGTRVAKGVTSAAFGGAGVGQVYDAATNNKLSGGDRVAEALGGATAIVGAGREAGEAVGGNRPGHLRRTAQRIAGAGDKAVVKEVGTIADKANTASTNAIENNREIAEQRGRRQQIQQRVDQKTQHLNTKVEGIKSRAFAVNRERWNTVRDKVGTQPVDMTEIMGTIKAQESKMDPEQFSIFRQMLSEGSAVDEIAQMRQQVMSQAGLGRGSVHTQFKPNGDPYQVVSQGKSYEELPHEQRVVIDSVVESEAALKGIDPNGVNDVPFSRLHGWHTELGQKQFSGGQNIPGNIYKAIDEVRGAVRNTMDTTAKQHGAFEDLQDARKSHGEYQDAFGKQRHKPVSAADAQERSMNPEAYAQKAEAERVRRIAVHDPSYADDVADLNRDHDTLKSFPTEQAMRNRLEPPPDQPEVSLHAVREDLIKKNAAKWNDISQYKIRRLFTGALGAVIGSHAGGHYGGAAGFAAAEMMPNVAANIALSPKVLDWLAKPTAEDISTIRQIPHADQVRIVDGIAQDVLKGIQSGQSVKIAPETASMLGPTNMQMITAAIAAGRPKNAGEARKRVEAYRAAQ